MCMYSYNTDDVEYLSYYITDIKHDEAWNERVQVKKTRTYRDANGNTKTQTYTVWETREHPDVYEAGLNNNKNIDISRSMYNKIKKQWNVQEVFKDMHRNYYTKDGDRYTCTWDNNDNTMFFYNKEHHYTNKIKYSQSQFNYRDIDKDEALSLGLYEYPEINDDVQNPIIGYNKFISDNDIKSLQKLNCKYGFEKQINVFLCIYPNSNVAIAEDQCAYWQGGNKNELVICVGIDSISNKVKWSHCFSWQDDITMDVSIRNYINHMDTLNVQGITTYIENNLDKWKRKEFEDFNYISIDLSGTQTIWIWIVVFIVSLITCIIVNINDDTKKY